MSPRRWQTILEKVRAMDRSELMDRSRQEFAKRADGMLAQFGYDFAGAMTRNRQECPPGAFFFRPEQVDALLRTIRTRIPGQAEEIIRRAERICEHRFDLLGYRDLDYGESINWHLDLVHGKTAPRKPFHRVKYLDFAQVGDSKITWELNRHQHLVTLAKAYRLSGDDHFAREIFAQWRSWHEQNPYPIGTNWASTLEVGFRSLSWIWIHALLAGTQYLTPEFEQEYLKSQALNGRHLERYLSTYFSPNTHLLGEAVALFFLGTTYPISDHAERWKSLGWKIVLEQADRQVARDGFHFEQSVYYHVYALDFFLQAALLAAANGGTLPSVFEQTIERMLDALAILSRGGPPPAFGDDDGGRLLDPSRNRREHMLDPLATGAILFGRGDFKYLARELHEETIWLLGEAGVMEWDRLDPKRPEGRSQAFADTGIYVMASSESQAQAILKSEPKNLQSRGHAHADALSLCLQSAGRSLLIDPGTYEYVGDGPERNRYRTTGMHNSVTVDQKSQAEPAGPFSWQQAIPAKTDTWISGKSFTLFSGRQTAYTHLRNPVQHQRYVFASPGGVFLVRDVMEGSGEHELQLSWRLAADLQLVHEHLFRFKSASQGLAVLPAEGHGWSEESHKSPWSPAYGSERLTTLLKFRVNTRLPAEFATLFVAMPEAAEVPGKLVRLSAENSNSLVRVYEYRTPASAVQFFFAESGKAWNWGSVASDAQFVCLTRKYDGAMSSVILCHGSYVDVEGSAVLSMLRQVERCELKRGDTVEVNSSDPDAISSPDMVKS